MTSLSFNSIQNQTSIQSNKQPLALREGQVIHGTIKKLFPDQTAQVQVGNHSLIAKLETPLKAGDAHYFQVANTTGQVELKVVTSSQIGGQSPQQQLTQLMDAMNLPKTDSMRTVLTHFMNQNLPVVKEQLLQAESFLNSVPKQSQHIALQVISRMSHFKMPFTSDVFQALFQGSKTIGMNSAVSNLMEQVMRDNSVANSTKQTIVNQLQLIEKPLQTQVGSQLVARAALQLTDANAQVPQKLQALTTLKEAQVIPPQATLANWASNAGGTHQTTGNTLATALQQLQNATKENVPQNIAALNQLLSQTDDLTAEQKQQLTQIINRFAQLPISTNTVTAFANEMNRQLVQMYAQNSLTTNDATKLLPLLNADNSQQMAQQQLQNASTLAANSQQSFTQHAYEEAERAVMSNIDGKTMEQAMKSILRSLGIQHEAVLASGKETQIEQTANTLKPQLLALLADNQIASQTREAGEMLLARINGMQLLSTDNGHNHQLVMQVPLQFLGKHSEATLQWNGKMNKDGQIDSNYARILFYLNMESIEETMIDMQVQNRIISVTIFNDQPALAHLAEPFKVLLASSLEEKEYRLSTVQIKPYEKETSTPTNTKNSSGPEQQGGVDIRV